MVLLHVVAGFVDLRRIVALHINHQLSAAADRWSTFCRSSARALDVEFRERVVTVSNKGSVETAAREARYAAFSAELRVGDVLLLAHHSDDQIETILLSLFRGSAEPGVRSMPVSRVIFPTRVR